MSNHISVKRYITHNCVENCIANISDYYEIDFRPLFLFSWDFGFKTTGPILENNIHFNSEFISCVNNYFEISKSYLDLLFTSISNDLNDVMSCLTDGNIVLVSSDAYNLPWNLAYQKYHVPHSFLVTYDSIKKSINIIDSFSSNNILEVENLKELKINEFRSVQVLGDSQSKNNLILLRNRYLTFLESNIKNEVYNSIRNFSDYLDIINSIEKLTKNADDLSNDLLIRRLSNIANARYNTKCFFEYLQWPNKYIDAMDGIHAKWEFVKNMFIKIILSKRLKLISQIQQELLVIASLENDLCYTIIKEEKH
ncbi:hypothetical protein [Paenibacillus sp. BJ-4]|uniref:hypothetical protein n=1 Tax=Paenibacillus sp. BJ-4 TaxID=2878097 RepID=UPI001CF00D1E|nr:hypothetical protein [Paenibacillus sp. BJ-4]